MNTFISLTVYGLSDGALLALAALGFVLIYKATRVINFAQGEFLLVGAYMFYTAFVVLRLPLILAAVFGVLVAIVLGVVVERFILRPLVGESAISVIMPGRRSWISRMLAAVVHAGTTKATTATSTATDVRPNTIPATLFPRPAPRDRARTRPTIPAITAGIPVRTESSRLISPSVSEAVALGHNAKAIDIGDVALGSGTITAAANATTGTTIDGVSYNFAGIAPTSVVSVGAAGAERQITNVAAGA